MGGTAPAGLKTSRRPFLSRYQKRAASRRVRILNRFDGLVRQGLSRAKAAQLLRASSVSIWRWRKRGVVPAVDHCGRKAVAAKVEVPGWVLRRVERLQISGMGNARAWLSLAHDPRLPGPLAELLSGGSVAPSLLKLTRVKRTTRIVTVIEGSGFRAIVE